ncbi:MAG TPA: hypothetical protein DEA08_38325 [Planctomycetes bacterium]|nr:hypothetical protein [Planctomycetota bacterium]
MERRLIVMRHAKSSWKNESLRDHERPLNKRGRRDAPRIGEELASLGWVPQRVISSDATRTRETWELLAEPLGGEPEVRFTGELYLAGPNEVESALRPLPDEVDTAMVLGHNNGWEEVVAWLSRNPVTMTTANAALLSVEAPTWEDALDRMGEWTLHQVVRPKELD